MGISGFFEFKFRSLIFKPRLQLRMRLTNLKDIEVPALPPDYQIRTYRKGDEEPWVNIITSSFGKNYLASQTLNEILKSRDFDSNGLFFITYHEQPVGTICAKIQCNGRQKIGHLHMLGVTPAHQGKRLGRLLTLYALHYLERKGFQNVILDTDDCRLPAIRTYTDLGFEPVYLERSHKKRWKEALAKIEASRN
jgi:mycothiol synthase